MHKIKFFTHLPLTLALAGLLSVGCQSGKQQSSISQPLAPVVMPVVAAPVLAQAPIVATALAADSTTLKPPVRINAGSGTPSNDSSGNTWLPDQGFVGGDVVDRGSDMEIANTKDPAIYRTEHFSMDSFSCKLPNGKYVVKLHFAETYEGITEAGQRVFSFTVNGQEFMDFDVWVKAGGPRRAYIETINVEVTDGKLAIIFTSKADNPEINGIEILPAS
ncbi:MAG TPA: malectin [Verrucomicrobiae bacterium]